MDFVGYNHSQVKDLDPLDFKEIIQLEIKLTNGKGQVLTKKLTGQHARQWKDWIQKVCLEADEHGNNPDWAGLDWKIKIG